jgi:hypothetical protein
MYAMPVVICAMVFLSGIPPMIPQETSSWIQKSYDKIKTLGPDDVVIMWHDDSPAYYLDFMPAGIAILKQLTRQGVKVIHVGLYPDSVIMEKMFTTAAVKYDMEAYGYKYGEDWVDFGYITGKESGIAALYSNLWYKGTDVYGTPVEKIPMMQNLKTAKDLSLIIVLTGTTSSQHIRQGPIKYQVPLIVCGSASAAASFPQFVEAGTMYSFTHGWPGAAEYERLISAPGMATAGSNALSVLWYVVAFWIIVGNISYFGQKLSGGK